MANVNTMGGKDRSLKAIGLVPDATFKALLDVLWYASGAKQIEGKLIKLTGSNNFECTNCAQGDVANGRVIGVEKCKASPYYKLVVDLWSYTNGSGNEVKVTQVINVEYNGTATLGSPVMVYDSTNYRKMYANASGSYYILAADVPDTGRMDVLV